MKQYHAVTPSAPSGALKDNEGNPLVPFAGKTCGVRFEGGEAQFNDVTMGLKRLGLTAEEAAIQMVQDFGYDVFVTDDTGRDVRFVPPKSKKSAAEAPATGKGAKAASTAEA